MSDINDLAKLCVESLDNTARWRDFAESADFGKAGLRKLYAAMLEETKIREHGLLDAMVEMRFQDVTKTIIPLRSPFVRTRYT